MTAAKQKTPVPQLVVPGNLIDEFGATCALRDAFAPTERLYRKQLDQLKALVEEKDAADEFLCKGENFTLRISARSIQRKVDLAKVKKLLGAAKFVEAATVTLTALANYLTKPQIETVTYEEQTGSRSFDPEPIANP